MDRGGRESSGADLTASSGASGTWMESSSIRRRRLSSPSPSAFLTPAFDACAAAIPGSSTSSPVGGAGSLDLDPSLLRYTRSRPHLSSSDSSHLRSTSTRRRLRRLLQLRSSLSSVPSPLARGGCSSVSPLSPIDNLPPARSPPVYMTPVKVEVGENVVVMDGVVVSDSGSTSGMSLFKTEVCHAWDENGICRYGSKCQFAHGKEELRSAGPPMREKSKLPARRSGRSRSPFYSLPSAASGFAVDAAAGGTTRNVAPPAATSTLLTVEADCKQPVIPYLSPSRSVEPQWPPNQAAAAGGTAGHIAPPGAVITLLTEEEDCKQLATPLSLPRSAELLVQWPPAEAEDTQITQVLYGPSQRRRLPVFNQFCPEHADGGDGCNAQERNGQKPIEFKAQI